MKIRCDVKSTKAFTYKRAHVKLNDQGVGELDDKLAEELCNTNPHFTPVRKQKEKTDER